MKSEYKEEIIRTFALTLTKVEVEQLIHALQGWDDWGRDKLPDCIPEVFSEMLGELNRMIVESEVSQ